MRELTLRKFHRYLGAVAAPLILLQAVSGLMLSVDVLGRWQGVVKRTLHDVNLPALAAFWDTLLHEIHFGTGTAGLLHVVVVGVSLGLLALSGVFLFVRILSRTVGKRPEVAAPAAAAESSPTPRRRVGVAVVLAAVGVLALDIYIFSVAHRMGGLHVPQVYAASALQAHVARARTALERALGGGGEASLTPLWEELERAGRATRAMLGVAGEAAVAVESGRLVLPVEDPQLRRRVEGVARGLARLAALGGEARPGAGAGLDAAAFRRALDGLQASSRSLVEAYMDQVEADRARFSAVHLLLFCGAFFLLMGVGGVLYLYEAGRSRQLAAVAAARDTARGFEQRFRSVVREAADPLVVFDPGGAVVAASRSAAYLLDYPMEELHRLGIDDLAPGVPAAERKARWTELEPAAPVAMRSVWRRRGGGAVPVVLSLGLVPAEDAGGTPLVLAHARRGPRGPDPGPAGAPASPPPGAGA